MSIDVDDQNAGGDTNGAPSSDVNDSYEMSANEFTFYLRKDKELKEETKRKINKTYRQYTDGIYDLHEIQNLETPELINQNINVKDSDVEDYLMRIANDSVDDPRVEAIEYAAQTYAMQSALYSRVSEINKFITENEHSLSVAFNFQSLLLANGRVLPPIILEGKDLFMVEDNETTREVAKAFKIKDQARVISVVPTWRDYLFFSVDKPILPEKLLRPINEAEVYAWKRGSAIGWNLGLEQANEIYLDKQAELQSDYLGMVRFHILLKQKMVSNPVTGKINLGVTGNEDSLNVGEVIFEIAQLPKFNKNSELWKALPRISPIVNGNTIKREIKDVVDER